MGCCFSADGGGGGGGGHGGGNGNAAGGANNNGGGGGGGGGGRAGKGKAAEAFDPASLDEDLARLYELKHPLGSGSAGETWLCRCRQTEELVAVKLMSRPLPGGMTTSIFREAKIGAQLGRGHLNIVKPRDLVLTRRHLGLVMEYVAGGNMADYILKALLLRHGSFEPAAGAPARGLVLDEDEARYYFLQVVRAVDFCHRNAVVHRDLKMDNTLIDSSDPPRVKLCDFGFANWWPSLGPPPGAAGKQAAAAAAAAAARPPADPSQPAPAAAAATARRAAAPSPLADREPSASAAAARAARTPSNVATITGTPDYMSPQILSSKVHGRARGNYDAPKADVWACGVLLCVMCLGRFPFDGAGMEAAGTGSSESGSGAYGDGDGDDDGGGGGYDGHGGGYHHDYGAMGPEEAAQRQEQNASMSVYLQQQAVLGQRAVTGCPAGSGGSRAGSLTGGGGGGGGRSASSGGGRAASRAGSAAADGAAAASPSLPESGGDAGGGARGGHGDKGASAAAADGAGADADADDADPDADADGSALCAGGAPPRPKRWFDHPALSGSAAYLTAEARDLLARIFEPDEACRIGVGEILEHPWSRLPMPEPFNSALEQMRLEQLRIDAEVAAGAHASRDRDAALKQMVYAASQPFDPNVVSVGAAAVGAQVPLGGDDQGREGWGRAADAAPAPAPATNAGAAGVEATTAAAAAAIRSPSPQPVAPLITADGLPSSCVRRVSLSQVNPREWGNDDPAAAAVAPLRADPAEVARFFAMHSPDGLASAEPSRHGGEQALGALRGERGGGGGGSLTPPLVPLGEDASAHGAAGQAAGAASAAGAAASSPADAAAPLDTII